MSKNRKNRNGLTRPKRADDQVPREVPNTWSAGSFGGPVVANTLSRYALQVLHDGPFGYWRLDDVSGSTCVDVAAVPHNGTYAGAVILNQPGALLETNPSVDFMGSTGQVTNTASLASITGTCTIAAWVRPRTVSGVNARMIFAGNTTTYMALSINAKILGSFNINGGQQTFTGTSAASLNAWHHFVVTWDGDKIRTYLDGVLDMASSSIPPGTGLNFGSGTFRIGAYDGTVPDNFWDGRIDEVALFNYALTAQQIKDHYTLGTTSL